MTRERQPLTQQDANKPGAPSSNPIMQTRDPDRPTHVSRKKSTFGKTQRIYTLCLLAFLLFILIGLSGYWLKSQLGINFFGDISISRHFPFNFLAPHKVICNPQPGILLHDSFDNYSFFDNWNKLWMREEGKVTKEYNSRGINDSRCLLIKSSSSGSWSLSHKKYIQVKKGDTFTFTVSVELYGENVSAYAGVAAFNKRKKAISWNYISEATERATEWVTLDKSFTIPEGIAFIQFRLSGIGAGEYRFDDVRFLKKKPLPNNNL